MKFECHITTNVAHKTVVESVGGSWDWKFSQIDGDPLLGAKPFCYLTRYKPDFYELRREMDRVCENLEENGVPVLRRKIEQILLDTKTDFIDPSVL